MEILTIKCKCKTTYAVHISICFLKNNASEPVPPTDVGRDSRTSLPLKELGFNCGGINAVFSCGLQKKWSDKYNELHKIAFIKLAKNSSSCSNFLP